MYKIMIVYIATNNGYVIPKKIETILCAYKKDIMDISAYPFITERSESIPDNFYLTMLSKITKAFDVEQNEEYILLDKNGHVYGNNLMIFGAMTNDTKLFLVEKKLLNVK
jgi:hypothetical protein